MKAQRKNVAHLVAAAVDALAFVEAEIAILDTRRERYRAVIIKHGVGRHEGTFHTATVSESVRATLNMDAVRAKLSPQFLAKHTRRTTVTSVRLTSRRTKR